METAVTFPGLPAIVPSARRFVRGILEGSPRADDMELIAAELISNAILHSPSGEDGGEFTVTVCTGDGWARVEVSDTGTGEWHPPDGTDLDAVLFWPVTNWAFALQGETRDGQPRHSH